ncbi:hypothetical protein F4776DRAFT_667915 [Hypoxylon sp. NC0597]|nr:hypothetical protein F4776DRAFT_667915 [Hypoxylon sp. NC0597]
MAVISASSITSAPSLPQPTSDGGLGVRGDTLVTLTVARESSTCVTIIQLGKTQDEGSEATAACCTGETVASTPSVAGGSAAENPPQNPRIALRQTVTLFTICQTIPLLHIQYHTILQGRKDVGRRNSQPIAAFRDPRAPLDLQDRKGRKGHQDHQDKTVNVALQDLQEDLRDRKVHKDCKVQWVCRAHVAEKDPPVRWGLKVIPALTALTALKVQWAHKAPLVDRPDLPDHRDYKDLLGQSGLWDLREDHRDRQVRRVRRDMMDHRAPKVKEVIQVDHRGRLDRLDRLDLLGLVGSRDLRALPADHQDPKDHRARKVMMDQWVPKVRGVIQVDHLGQPELPGLPGLPEPLDLLDLLDLLGHLALLQLVQRGHKGPKDLLASEVQQARPANRAQCNAVSNAGLGAGTPASVAAGQGTHVEGIVAVSVAVVIKTYTYNERCLLSIQYSCGNLLYM